MSVWFQNFALLSEQVGLGILLVYLYGIFARSEARQWVVDISFGTIFGIAALIAMANPIILEAGVIVDLRNMFVGVAAAYFGWRSGVLCALISVAMRLSLSGPGATAGVTSILIATTMGLVWYYVLRPRVDNKILANQILAAMISLHIVGGLLLPLHLHSRFYFEMVPLIILGNFAGVNVFGLLLSRERNLVSETKRLEKQAMTDPLTQILNRRSAISAYKTLQRRRPPKRGIAMTCIDVDKFKTINDTYGHLAGDQVLQEIAHRFGTCLRAENIVCRMSGDEFLFVLVNITSNEAKIITERCRSLIARVPVKYDEVERPVTVSMGTVWSAKPLPFEEFRSKAAQALYHAKKAGRDHTAFKINYAAVAQPDAA